ncbi:hypothetical protein AtNW77_Chr2g0225371 [Arabidopsis thaliana]
MLLTQLPTPIRLLTAAICSSIDLLMEEILTNLDLTCTNKLHCFWLKALEKLLLITFIYPLIFVIVILGFAPYHCIVIFGNSVSYNLYIWPLF